MKRIYNLSKWKKEFIALVYGGIIFLCACFISNLNYLISSFLLLFSAVILYFYFAYVIDFGNVISLKALFSTLWIGTIGLANLKLLGYQVRWEDETWFVLALSFCAFIFAFMLMEKVGFHFLQNSILTRKLCNIKSYFILEENRLFLICCITTLIGAISFCANILIKGYIPFFVTDDYMAYYDFYTRFNIFTVASTAVSGLCYYTIKTQKLTKFQKCVLYISILYEVFLMPILAVSRGTQMIAMLSLMVSVVTLNRRKFITFLLCMAIAFGFYQVGSAARHLSNEYLDYVFQPKEVTSVADSELLDEAVDVGEGENADTEDTIVEAFDAVEPDNVGDLAEKKFVEMENSSKDGGSINKTKESTSTDNEVKSFVLPAQVAFLYGYLTVSHDNFNEAVVHHTGYSYGLRQLQAFTAILRFPELENALEELEFWQVNDALNTGNLITDAYYDFGALGCGIFLFLWACVFSLIEQFARKYKGPFSMLALGNCMIPVVLCFFESWMSYFTFWLLWGTEFLLFVAATFHVKKQM